MWQFGANQVCVAGQKGRTVSAATAGMQHYSITAQGVLLLLDCPASATHNRECTSICWPALLRHFPSRSLHF
jgi:hypothetical protein